MENGKLEMENLFWGGRGAQKWRGDSSTESGFFDPRQEAKREGLLEKVVPKGAKEIRAVFKNGLGCDPRYSVLECGGALPLSERIAGRSGLKRLPKFISG